ncbi:glycoside hydrolase, partial [Candidatus Gastranaerophilus sp. (ex Termes propinquus)]
LVEKLSLHLDIRNAQDAYFERIFKKLPVLIEHMQDTKNKEEKDQARVLALLLLDIGKKINIQADFYREYIDKASLPTVLSAES